jgi:uncharacterized protein with von Willebrand factor type A (vWA) domain
MHGYRYGAWHGGPDPLAPPFDVREAVDELGDSVLQGLDAREALNRLLERGMPDGRGLDALRRDVRRRRRSLQQRGRLDGTLEEARRLLDTAVGQERAALFPDPSDGARLREAELDALPPDTARAVRQLNDYEWRSEEAAATFEQLRDLLRREVVDQQFRGMRDALQGAGPEDWARVRSMLDELTDLLAADARGEDTTQRFAQFMQAYGDFFPEQPQSLEELVDALARRAAAAQRLMASLSPGQRDELAALAAGAMADAGLEGRMQALAEALRRARPDLDWTGRQRLRGETPLGLGDATTALEELADLEELESTLAQDYAGASLDDVDEDQVARALGRQAVDDLDRLRRLERELEQAGWLQRDSGRLELTPRAVRRLGQTALRRIFTNLETTRRGDHELHSAGAAGEPTGAARAWEFGDEQPLDVVRTLRNAVLRSGPGNGRLRLTVEDFEVVETERRGGAAVALLVDLSYSMALRGTWAAAKTTALALHALVTTRYPQDAIEVIGFSAYARRLEPAELAGLGWDMVQGTNLQHGLMIARRFLARHPSAEPVVMVVTDGEPTAHLTRDGRVDFCWPPLPETLAVTMAEVDRLTRAGATINVFMLDDEPGLVRFVDGIARRNGGRVLTPSTERLGEYVVSDYLRARRGRRRALSG